MKLFKHLHFFLLCYTLFYKAKTDEELDLDRSEDRGRDDAHLSSEQFGHLLGPICSIPARSQKH